MVTEERKHVILNVCMENENELTVVSRAGYAAMAADMVSW